MTFPRWDRIFYFAFFATAFSVLAYLVLLFFPLISVVSSEFEGVQRRTLLADGQVTPVLISLLPVAVTAGTLLAIPRDRQPGRSGKINLWLSTFLMYVFVVISILSIGFLFVIPAIFLTAAAVGAQIRRRACSCCSAACPLAPSLNQLYGGCFLWLSFVPRTCPFGPPHPGLDVSQWYCRLSDRRSCPSHWSRCSSVVTIYIYNNNKPQTHIR